MALTKISGSILKDPLNLGEVSIGGTLTYQDVTNVDSVGIVTARSGIHIDDSITHIGDTNTKIRFPAADTITAETGGSERFRISSTGNVSIGNNATPDTLLHLQGDTPKLRIESTNKLEASAGTEEIGRIEFEATKGSNINVAASLRVRQDGTWSTVDDWFSPTAIEFYTQDQSGTEITTPRLTINKDGGVGIGTVTPAHKLEVIDGIINVGAAVTTNDSRIQFTRNDTGMFGWIGIPNWNPNSLWIYGPKDVSPYNEAIAQYESEVLKIYTGGTERLHIASNGLITVNRDGVGGRIDATAGDASIKISDGNGRSSIKVSDPGSGNSYEWELTSAGNFKAPNGKGIDFSATGSGSGTGTSELFDDYEEGSFSATASAAGYSGGSAISMSDEKYTKIGRIVHFNMRLAVASNLSDGDLTITNLPFTAAQDSVVNFSWQDAAGFHGGQGKISGTSCVRHNGTFPTHSSGTANIIFSGTYRTS